MEADDSSSPLRLENTLIRSYAHFRSFKLLNASFKDTKYLNFEGMLDHYINCSMTKMQGSQYLMDANHGRLYCVDIDSLKAERLQLDMEMITNCFIEGEYMLLVRFNKPMLILRDRQVIGQIEITVKHEICKNGSSIHGRYAQRIGQSVYAVGKGGGLYRIEWQDIKNSKYRKKQVKSNAEGFYVDKRLGFTTLHFDNTLSLASTTIVDLRQKVDPNAKWTIVTCIAKYWVVSGDFGDQSSIESITNKGDVRSTLKLKLTSNGHVNSYDIEHGGIFSLHQVYARGRRSIMMAIERDGCCHLISVVNGRMAMLQSIASIVSDEIQYKHELIVMSVTATGTEGEFMAGGWNWTKKINLKLK